MTEEKKGPDGSKINGVETDFLEKIINLLRYKYKDVSNALRYLEVNEMEYDLVGLSNVRDFVSHLATICHPDRNYEQRYESLASAEEHLRRAIAEPLQTCLEAGLENFLIDYADYEKEFLKNENKYGISKITDHPKIRKGIRQADNFLNDGRKKKDSNIWNSDFEQGVQAFILGYEKVCDLKEELKMYKEKYYQNRWTRRRNIGTITISAIIALMLAFAFKGLPKPFFEFLTLMGLLN